MWPNTLEAIARLLGPQQHGEVVEQHGPSGRVPEAPHIAGHRAPEQAHPSAAQAPPPVPVGAPVDDVMAGLPGTRAEALPRARAPGPEGCGPAAHLGQARKREAASPGGPTAADASGADQPPQCFCDLPAGARRVKKKAPTRAAAPGDAQYRIPSTGGEWMGRAGSAPGPARAVSSGSGVPGRRGRGAFGATAPQPDAAHHR